MSRYCLTCNQFLKDNEIHVHTWTKETEMIKVTVYDIYNNTHVWEVSTWEKAREYAKRIILEGLWYKEGKDEIFMPVWEIIKVKIGEGAVLLIRLSR